MGNPTRSRTVSVSSTNRDGPRYPRSKWFRRLQWILNHWWLILIVACLLDAIFNISLLAANSGGDLHVQPISKFISVLPFALIIEYNLWFVVLSIAMIVILTLTRRWANNDDLHERSELTQSRLAQRKEPGKQHLPGFNLRHTLHQEQNIHQIAWSPESRLIAAGVGTQISLWDTETGQLLNTLAEHSDWIHCVAWSPDGRTLSSGSDDSIIRLWDTQTGQLLHAFTGHSSRVRSVVWSPDAQLLASSSDDRTIRLWDAQSGQLLHILTGHSDRIRSVVWSPNAQLLASGSDDQTIRLWNPGKGGQIRILEGHTHSAFCVTFSYDSRLLASKSYDGTVRLWRSDTWEIVTVLRESSSSMWTSGIDFHPTMPALATLGKNNKAICIWDLDIDVLLGAIPATPTVRYTNAKVVLVGDSGVGKSGLGLVLSKQPYVPTDSTHGCRVWTFDNQEFEASRHKETREILLWDLAGQPGYRLTHQLHLNEVTVALVVFDVRSEITPFAGVEYWDRALRQAQRVQGSSALPMKKFLVIARADRGGTGVSRMRIESLMNELGFNGHFETSAKEGWQIAKLAEAIRGSIDWEMLPKVSSTDLFQHIKAFLVAEKEKGRLLSTVEDLYGTFLGSNNAPSETEDLRAQFETCIGLVESEGLIKRLSFGKLVLLQLELFDAYASALVNAVQEEPDSLGCIVEEKVRTGNFRMPQDERLKDKEQERLLLIAMTEHLLRQELVLREEQYLVFPSQSTRENPDLPDPKGKAVIFHFEGPVLNIYATLVVRLSHSGLFKKREMWKNAVTYTASGGGICGILLHNVGEGCAELALFFDQSASEQMRFLFEEYVQIHLQRRALSENLHRRRIFVCDVCGAIVTEQVVRLRLERSFDWLTCSVCDNNISLLDREEGLVTTPSLGVLEMDRAADSQRDREAAESIVRGKKEIEDFDVFLCHNAEDKPAVKKIGEQLKEQGILPWLDEWELRPGLLWQRSLEQQIEHIKAAAVFVGKDGRGPWRDLELYAFLRQFVKRECPVIPVILSDCNNAPDIPIFLESMTWVDFRKQAPDPMEHLIWGITGIQRGGS